MSQPGAASRLTAVYRYVVEAARDRLSGREAPIAVCPACERDDGAVSRALDTLLEGLADDQIRERYRELGGLCIPHLGAASVRGGHRVVAWMSQAMAEAARSVSPDRLSGTDRDAEVRAVLRQAAPASARPGSGACLACLAAVRSENARLTQILHTTDRGLRDGPLLLCAGHLGDLVVLAGQRGAASVLAWQADCLAAGLTRRVPAPGRKLGGPVGWLRSGRRRPGPDGCPACLASRDAADRAVDDFRASLRASPAAPRRWAPLCVRHLLSLRAADPWAGQVTARGSVAQADMLVAELNEAFSKSTWARRHEARGPEMTAWRRAAAFVDGSVFCGCPPHDA